MDKALVRAADQIMFALWDLTTGMGGSPRVVHKNAAYFAQFVLSQIDEEHRLASSGETHIESRGLVIPRFILKAWTWNVLEDCYRFRCTPPWDLLLAVYSLLDCTHLDNKRRKQPSGSRAELYEGSLREAARRFNVAPTTIRSWRQRGSQEVDQDLYRALMERTKVCDYWPRVRYRRDA